MMARTHDALACGLSRVEPVTGRRESGHVSRRAPESWPIQVLELQRQAGNAAVCALLSPGVSIATASRVGTVQRCGCGRGEECDCVHPVHGTDAGEKVSVQRASGRARGSDCPGYERGEIARSRTAEGLLPEDTRLLPGHVHLMDFGINRRSVKGAVRRDPRFRRFVADVETDDTFRLDILGLDDCVGTVRARERLREGRARRVLELFSPAARPRVRFAGAADANLYVITNMSSGGRAMNRGALIAFDQQVDGKPANVRGRRPRKFPGAKTEGCGAGAGAKHPAAEVDAAHRRAAAMLTYAIATGGDWASRPNVQELAAKHFKIGWPPWRLEPTLWRKVRSTLAGMRSAITEATYECEPSQSVLHGGCGEGTDAVALSNIHLCPKWWTRTPDERAEVLLHEWAHKWGDGVARVFETYCWETEYSGLSADKRVKLPDAYSSFIFELVTGSPPSC